MTKFGFCEFCGKQCFGGKSGFVCVDCYKPKNPTFGWLVSVSSFLSLVHPTVTVSSENFCTVCGMTKSHGSRHCVQGELCRGENSFLCCTSVACHSLRGEVLQSNKLGSFCEVCDPRHQAWLKL